MVVVEVEAVVAIVEEGMSNDVVCREGAVAHAPAELLMLHSVRSKEGAIEEGAIGKFMKRR